MIKSYPIVDDEGRDFGGEVSFDFSKLYAVEKMYKWIWVRPAEDMPREERRELVEGCCTIHVGREEFNIRADYNEVLNLFKEQNEMFG